MGLPKSGKHGKDGAHGPVAGAQLGIHGVGLGIKSGLHGLGPGGNGEGGRGQLADVGCSG